MYVIDVEKGSIGLSVITLIPIYDFHVIFGVTARYGEIGEIRGVMFGCRHQGGDKDKAAFYIYEGLFPYVDAFSQALSTASPFQR